MTREALFCHNYRSGNVSSSAAFAVIALGVWEELTHREAHLAEHLAGIGRRDRGSAVLVGQTEVRAGYHELNGAFHPDYREKTDRYDQFVRSDAVHKVTVEAVPYGFGDGIDADAAAAVMVMLLNDFAVEYDRRSDLHDDRGELVVRIAADLFGSGAESVVIGIRHEYADVLFAAEKDYFFIVNAKTFDFGRASVADAGFDSHAEIVSDADLIVPLVERYGFDVDAGPYDLNVLSSDGCRSVDDLLSAVA